MSYAIVRNEKLTRDKAKGMCYHNDRRTKKHSNKDIDINKSHLNYYLKKNKLTYVKEFDKLRKENNLQGQIRKNSIIMCEMIFTSDKEFFEKIGEDETKRYFKESYNFICNYQNLGEKNIISAVVHLDEGTPHMHLMYIPVIHTKDKENNCIDKICARNFWKGRDSYRKLQDSYFKYVKEKGFDLERGIYVEETNREHLTIEEYKNITNFENTKTTLKDIQIEIPKTPNISEFNKLTLNRDKKIEEEIIKPKDILIQKLYEDNSKLVYEITKQANLIDKAEKYEKERKSIKEENLSLKQQVEENETNFSIKLKELSREIENKYEDKIYHLEKENKFLKRIINTFEKTVDKFIHWICKKFAVSSEDSLIRDFQKETNIYIDPEKQIKQEDKERDLEL